MTLKKLNLQSGETWDLRQISAYLQNHSVHLARSEFESLPEMTQHNGVVYHRSCHAQAWSIGCILESILL